MLKHKLSRPRKKELGRLELIAIALGGMVGGGIFSILGVSVDIIGKFTPLAILLGGVLAFFAAYSYVKLALYYKDEGATYSFYKKTYPNKPFFASLIGWFVVFGYISTLALYAFTFSSYFLSYFEVNDITLVTEIVSGFVILIFVIINILSVNGMGKVEDILVYTKIIILLVLSGLFIGLGDPTQLSLNGTEEFSILSIFIVSSITFVAFEGFQLVIHAYNEVEDPDKNVPFAIYSAIAIALVIYIVLAVGALSAIPQETLIRDQEFALAAGASKILGDVGQFVVIFGALLATSSAISGTLFGSSRLMTVIARDGYFPKFLRYRNEKNIPVYSILTMAFLAFILILSGSLKVILEFGSITFIIVSVLMALANFKVRNETKTNTLFALVAIVGLTCGGLCLFYYELTNEYENILYILGLYIVLLVFSLIYSKLSHNEK
jgi:amino acid transporter